MGLSWAKINYLGQPHPESIKEAIYSWSNNRVTEVYTTSDTNGDTTDRIDTASYACDGNGNLTTINTAMGNNADSTADDTGTVTATYSANTLTGFTENLVLGSDASADYTESSTPTFPANGMPTGCSLIITDQPVNLSVLAGLLN